MFSDIPITELLPQRPPFLFVDRLEDFGEGFARVSLVVPREGTLVDGDGVLCACALVEHMAQACAAFSGYMAKYVEHVPSGVGYIGQVRHFSFRRLPRSGERLDTVVTVVHRRFGMLSAGVEIRVDGEVVASCKIKTVDKGDAVDMPGGEADAASWRESGGKEGGALLRDWLYRQESAPAAVSDAFQGGVAAVRLLPDCSLYRGHFPGFPVTPGVTLLQMALEVMPPSWRLVSAEEVKFLIPVLPAMETPGSSVREGTLLSYRWACREGGEVAVEGMLPDGSVFARFSLRMETK